MTRATAQRVEAVKDFFEMLAVGAFTLLVLHVFMRGFEIWCSLNIRP